MASALEDLRAAFPKPDQISTKPEDLHAYANSTFAHYGGTSRPHPCAHHTISNQPPVRRRRSGTTSLSGLAQEGEHVSRHLLYYRIPNEPNINHSLTGVRD